MEYVSGKVKLRDIFLDNGNWWKLFLKYRHLIRISIIVNVLKLLVCKTRFLGYHLYVCPQCDKTVKAPHSCKSRFCPSCGKKATDDWIKNSFNSLPDTRWQHITYTMPSAFWDFFWLNRPLMNKLPLIAANTIKELSRKKGFIPGIYLAIHTFGRDLKRNVHIHLSTTMGGLSLSKDSLVEHGYFYHDTLKKMWRHRVIYLLREEFQKGSLKLPPHLKHIKSYQSFCSWTDQFYRQKWVVHLTKPSEDFQHNLQYLGKYLKRPPIGETRIKNYDGKSVTFEYLDHYTDTTETVSLPVLEFLKRLIAHIPEKNFRNIRYYGFLANRVRKEQLPIVLELLNQKPVPVKKVYTPWRQMIKRTFRYDPLKCSFCGAFMRLGQIVFPMDVPLTSMHKEIANGYFPLV